MPNVDKNWISSQLEQNKTKIKEGKAVMNLIAAWENIELNSEEQKRVIEVFSKLSLGIPLVLPINPDNEQWVQARAGAIKVGDEVMVKKDAFVGDLGFIHNGRRGKVIAVRYGDIIVNSTDGKTPVLSGTHYNPSVLQKLVR